MIEREPKPYLRLTKTGYGSEKELKAYITVVKKKDGKYIYNKSFGNALSPSSWVRAAEHLNELLDAWIEQEKEANRLEALERWRDWIKEEKKVNS